MKKWLLLLTLSVTFLSLQISHTSAASSTEKILTVTPAAARPYIEPGQSGKGSFQIVNQGTVGYSVEIYSAPYGVKGEDYTPDFTPIPGKANVASWLHLAVADAAVSKGQTVTVPYTIAVPADTKPGGYYAVIFVESKGPLQKSGVVVNERVGEIFYIHVAGPVKQAGKLDSWQADFLQKQPLVADLRLENDGGVHYPATTRITVADIFGRVKYSYLSDKEILPQTIRHQQLRWDGATPIGLFKVSGTTTISGRTVVLPSKYILIMAPVIRYIGLGLIALLLVSIIVQRIAKSHDKKVKGK